MHNVLKVSSPLKIEIKRARDEHIITFDKTELRVCKPKIEAEWSWSRFKTRKIIVHLKRNGKIEVSDFLVTKVKRRK
jgi:hypothetical protein